MRKIKFLRYFAIIDRITKNGVRKPLFCPSSDYEQQQKKKIAHATKVIKCWFFFVIHIGNISHWALPVNIINAISAVSPVKKTNKRLFCGNWQCAYGELRYFSFFFL